MQRPLEEASSDRTVSITIGADTWRLYIYGVVRVGRELFVQAALFGPRTCTAVVRVGATRTRRDASREVLRLIADWLGTGDLRDHVFLESADTALVC